MILQNLSESSVPILWEDRAEVVDEVKEAAQEIAARTDVMLTYMRTCVSRPSNVAKML